MFDDGMGAPKPYAGAYDALMSEYDSFIGRPEVDDIIGLNSAGEDYAQCEAEYSGDGGVPLSSYTIGDEGAYPGGGTGMSTSPGLTGPQDPMADPMDSATVRNDMRDLLQDRALQRQAASEQFQAKARQFK